MNTVEIDAERTFAVGSETIIHLPSGLLGFEQCKRYLLHSKRGEEPFYWLEVLDEPSISFVIVSPFEVVRDYVPDIPAEDIRLLGIECPDDALLLNIVTLRRNCQATINLKGPIVINRFTRIARQVIISNAADYSVQHPFSNE